MTSLFSPFTLGALRLPNRVVMAPMTRCRAEGNVANALMAEYYAARAAAGLLVTEGVAPSAHGLGYARIPGLYTAAHVAGWRLVTDAVHAAGGRIFAQLMHTGRVAHPANLPAGGRIQAPSPVAAPGEMWTDAGGPKPHPVPAEMTDADILRTIGEFADACARAIEAGFDGVELHGANGYLIDQFLNTASNRRTDRWGGTVANRIRFALEVAQAAASRIGGARVGIRVSPYGVFNAMTPDPEMDALYGALVEGLNPLGLAYIHVVDHSAMGAPPVSASLKAAIRASFRGAYILSGGYETVARADADLAAGHGDLVAFGRPFLANPDLVERLRAGEPLKAPDQATFYTPGPKGYTDLA